MNQPTRGRALAACRPPDERSTHCRVGYNLLPRFDEHPERRRELRVVGIDRRQPS
jgi:hypothetical protein